MTGRVLPPRGDTLESAEVGIDSETLNATRNRGAAKDLTSGSLLARNAIWNLLALGLPTLFAIVTVPILIHGLGAERFGVLTLSWLVVGYFSLFDLGLSRALTQLVAEKLGRGRDTEVPPLVWTALLLMLVFGTVGAIIAASLAPAITDTALRIPRGLRKETLSTVYLLAVSIPVVILTGGLRGVLEAYQLFFLSNALRLPLGVFTYVGPALVLPFSHSLPALVAVLVLGRIVGLIAYLFACLKAVPGLLSFHGISGVFIRPLVAFGSWVTVSNVVSPALVYLDRFLIGALVSVAAVTYYATPSLMAVNVLVIPAAIVGVLFPAFATSFSQDRARASLIFSRGVKYIFLGVFPVSLLLVVFAHPLLRVWVGPYVAARSGVILQTMAVGILVNSVGQVPFTIVQASGRPDLTGKLHLVELPVYVLALVTLVHFYGIEGAAVAWVGRLAVDTVVCFLMARHVVPETGATFSRMTVMGGAALLTLALGAAPSSGLVKSLFAAAALAFFGISSWFLVLSRGERSLIEERVNLLR